MVGWLLDLELRSSGKPGSSLDRVLRDLFQRFASEAARFSREDLMAALKWASGSDFAGFFARFVDGTEPLEIESALAAIGLELSAEDVGLLDKADVEESERSLLKEAWLEGC